MIAVKEYLEAITGLGLAYQMPAFLSNQCIGLDEDGTYSDVKRAFGAVRLYIVRPGDKYCLPALSEFI